MDGYLAGALFLIVVLLVWIGIAEHRLKWRGLDLKWTKESLDFYQELARRNAAELAEKRERIVVQEQALLFMADVETDGIERVEMNLKIVRRRDG